MKPTRSEPLASSRQGFARAAALVICLALAPAWAALNVNTANGTVTDTITKLVWDQCPYGLSGSTCASGTVLLGSWKQALDTATTANSSNYKGFNDWRLPNKNELVSITKTDSFTDGLAAIDNTAFPNTPISGDGWGQGASWTSTSYMSDPLNAWFVNFYSGYTSADVKTRLNYVRLVRSGQTYATFDAFGVSTQTITFSNPGPQILGTTPKLTATASSGLPTTLTSGSTAVCTITSSGVLTLITTGTCSIQANQAGNSSYAAAAQVTQNFLVLPVTLMPPGPPTILSITAGAGYVQISLQDPVNTGGGSIVAYGASCSASGLPTVSASSTSTSVIVAGLSPGVTYTCTATASNASYASAASVSVVTPVVLKSNDLSPMVLWVLD